MGYWGLAMSERPNPLVPPFPTANLKAGLEAVQKGKKAPLQTPREAEYISAMDLFYEGYGQADQRSRTQLYLKAMRRLHEHYPSDSEASIFYALALNEAVDLADKTFSKQLEAASILHSEGKKHPDHPGIAHYLIHSYDFTPLADKGMSAARSYDKLAPSSPHALHMPSHTYSMLGMWQDSIRANRAAAAAAESYAATNLLGATDPSLPHFLDFLEYAYLQLGRDADAELIVAELSSVKKFASVRLTVDTAMAAIPARYAIERGQWNEAGHLNVRESPYPAAKSISYFARALGAARSKRPLEARAAIRELNRIQAALVASKDDYWAGQTRIQTLAAEAWALFSEGNRERAIAQMRSAAGLDDASEKNVGMENKLFPMRALLGELYLEAGLDAPALTEFQASLKANPNRCRSFAGAILAAHGTGLRDKERYYVASLSHLLGIARPKGSAVNFARAVMTRR